MIDNDQLPDSKRNIGSHTNIFQLGAAIFCLMTLRDLYDYKGETFSLSWNETLSKGGHTAGKDLITGVWEPGSYYQYWTFPVRHIGPALWCLLMLPYLSLTSQKANT